MLKTVSQFQSASLEGRTMQKAGEAEPPRQPF